MHVPSDEALLTTMVILRLNLDGDEPTCVPTRVREVLIERGWIEVERTPEDDWRYPGLSVGDLRITDAGAGAAASDLFAPELGVDPVPVGSEAT